MILVLQTLVLTASAETALTLRAAEWKQCVHFPVEEPTLKPPEALLLLNPKLLDPALEGSFAQHTLLNRLPAVVSRLIADGAVDDSSMQRLRALSAEVPTLVPLRLPQAIVPSSGGGLGVDEVFCAHFNGEWQRWATEREAAKHSVFLRVVPHIPRNVFLSESLGLYWILWWRSKRRDSKQQGGAPEAGAGARGPV